MVVLENPSGSTVAAVGLLDPPAPTPIVVDTSAATTTPTATTYPRSTMKILPKRFINLHQWLGPICAKQLKEVVVGIDFFIYISIINYGKPVINEIYLLYLCQERNRNETDSRKVSLKIVGRC